MMTMSNADVDGDSVAKKSVQAYSRLRKIEIPDTTINSIKHNGSVMIKTERQCSITRQSQSDIGPFGNYKDPAAYHRRTSQKGWGGAAAPQTRANSLFFGQ